MHLFVVSTFIEHYLLKKTILSSLLISPLVTIAFYSTSRLVNGTMLQLGKVLGGTGGEFPI